MTAILSLRCVNKNFGHGDHAIRAVRDVSLDVEAGECLAIVGESGSGKTTLANMILGVFPPDSGAILLDGAPLPPRRLLQHRSQIQLVQQNPLSSLNPRRTVGASIRLGLDVYGIGQPRDRWKIVESALEEVGLPVALRHRPPGALSGGQRQRVAIARALACESRILVLDEPTSALDVLVQARVLRLLDRLRRKRGLTYLFITHDLSVVRNIADRVTVFRAGTLIESGPTARIFQTPKQAYTRDLIAAVPVVTGDEIALRRKLTETCR